MGEWRSSAALYTDELREKIVAKVLANSGAIIEFTTPCKVSICGNGGFSKYDMMKLLREQSHETVRHVKMMLRDDFDARTGWK